MEFKELNRFEPAPLALLIDPGTLLRPQLAFSYEIVDDPERSEKAVGNADGVIQRGEAFDLVVTVKNLGRLRAQDAQVSLSLVQDPSVTLYSRDQQRLGDLAPGETKSCRFNVAVRAWSRLTGLTATVRAWESYFGAQDQRRVTLPFGVRVEQPPVAVSRNYYVKADGTVLRTGASEAAPEYARAPKNMMLHAVGELPEWVQVELPVEEAGEKRTEKLWVRRDALSLGAPATAAMGTVVVTRFETPPSIVFVQPDRAQTETIEDQAELVVSVSQSVGALTKLEVLAGRSESALEDVTGSVEIRKAAEGEAGDSRVIKYSATLSLGTNVIKVRATNDQGRSSERSVVITRKEALDEASMALVVGIEDYVRMADLPGCHADAQAVAEAVRRTCRLPEGNVRVMTEAAGGENIPSEGNLAEAIKRVASLVQQGGLFFFYFSGHGVMRGGDVWLVPWDGRPEEGGIALQTVLAGLDESPARAKVLVIDACRETLDGKGVGEIVPDLVQGRADTAVFFSCDAGQTSWLEEDRRHSVYTTRFVRALNEARGDGALPLTARGLQERIQKLMREWERLSPKTQRPVLRLVGHEDVVLVPGTGQ